MFTLRRYTPADQAAVEHLHITALQQVGAYLGRGPWDDDMYAIEETYLQKRGDFLIGEVDGIFAAMGALKRTDDVRAEVKRMRVMQEYQGRGYGQRILEHLQERARELGYRILHLDTSVLQVPAQRLYEKNGFSVVGREHYRQEIGEGQYQSLEVILYEKAI